MVAAALCVACVILGDIDRAFAWQAWHWAGSGDALGSRLLPPSSPRPFALVLRGRRGTSGTELALVTHLVPVCRRGRRGTLRGMRYTW